MDATKQKKLPDLKLREDPHPSIQAFVLKFKTDEDMDRVISILRKDGGFSQKVVNGETLTLIGREQLLQLNRIKELNYEVW